MNSPVSVTALRSRPIPSAWVSKGTFWYVFYRPGLPSLVLCVPQLVVIHHRSGHLLLTLGPRIS